MPFDPEEIRSHISSEAPIVAERSGLPIDPIRRHGPPKRARWNRRTQSAVLLSLVVAERLTQSAR